MRILVVEDDPDLGPFLVRALEEASHAADRARTLEEARGRLKERPYDLVSLDVTLPDGSGLDLLREIRAAGHSFPVLVLTSRGEVRQKVEGLDRGADDYLLKPFALDEYLSRVRALLRRGGARPDPILRLGGITCDEAAHRVTVSGREVALTPKEFSLLAMFLRSPGVAISRSQAVNSVWKWSFDGYSNVVDVHVSALRRKLRGSGVRFRAVPGVGYLVEEETAATAGGGDE